jgi:hypothetical protein
MVGAEMHSRTSSIGAAERAARKHGIAWFASAGLLSGVLSTYLSELPGSGLLDSIGGFNFYPGIYFGLALCVLFYKRLGAPLARLAIVLLVVQASWQAAVRVGVAASNIGELKKMPIAETEAASVEHASSEDTSSQPTSAGAPHTFRSIIAYDLIIPGLIAGLVGAFGTWLATIVAIGRLRSFESGLFTTVIGGVAGLLLAVDLPLLYIVWQSVVAASLASRMTLDIRS